LEVRTYIPHPALQQYVLNISTVKAVLPPGIEQVVTPYPPTPFQSLIFYCNDPIQMGREDKVGFERQPLSVLIGPQYSRVNIKVVGRLTAIRVDFLPGGMYRLLGVPMHQLFDAGFNALDFFGPSMKTVNDQLQHISTLDEGKNIVESFLLKKTPDLKELLPFDDSIGVMLKHHGNISIPVTASMACMSIKQFERKCRERIGMSPKMYARILRFSKAYRLHEAFPQISWTKIAYEAGYYDQMHMIRDFKTFAGVNPSVIERQLLATPLRMQKDIRY
jgi:AraC-like DNA-binding protein